MDLKKYGFSKSEISLIKKLRTPQKIQKFIDESIKYDSSREDRSVLDVIRDGRAECFNGALFAMTCLMYHGYESTLIELTAKKDEEHILAVYEAPRSYDRGTYSHLLRRERNPSEAENSSHSSSSLHSRFSAKGDKKDGCFGSIAQSKFLGLKDRYPIYLSLRDLAVSYMEFYISFDGRYSLINYTNWMDFAKYKLMFLNNSATVSKIASDLHKSKPVPLTNARQLEFYADPERYWREIMIIPPGTRIPQKYLRVRKKIKI